MANTYTQIHIQCVFAVKFRDAMIHPSWKESLHRYITGIIQGQHHKMIAINTMPDHLHLLFGMRPTQSLSDLMQMVKGDSSGWINTQRFCKSLFRWQEGFGAFSYDKTRLPDVANYIFNQEIHHQKKRFKDEYIELLNDFGIDYNEKYLFADLQ